MAICIGTLVSLLLLHICAVVAAAAVAVAAVTVAATDRQFKFCSIDSIYQFGDSISDTGNQIRETPIGFALPISRHPPYGMTFFRRPTGRYSDGLLMIDYFALALGLPFLNPYLEKDADFSTGVNFAVAGACALDTSFFAKEKLPMPGTNSSISVQLDWFRTHLKSLCSTQTECKQKLKKALFLVGEIGVNDYYHFFIGKKTRKEIQNLVPHVVQKIKDAVREVIDLGATQLIVPGCLPLGCTPSFLTLFKSNDSTSYDRHNCLKIFNKFIKIHNEKLQQALQELREEYMDVDIVYADYYAASMWVLTHGPSLGFEVGSIQKSCCGVGGDYNYDVNKTCGDEGVPVCPDPRRRMSWDGAHLTMMGYKFMAEWLHHNIKPKTQCLF